MSQEKERAQRAAKESLSVKRCVLSAVPRLTVTASFSFMIGMMPALTDNTSSVPLSSSEKKRMKKPTISIESGPMYK